MPEQPAKHGIEAMRWPLVAASLLGFSAIALGALGSHFLQSRLPAEDYARFTTALDMHRTHALALLALGFYARRTAMPEQRWLGLAAACFTGGIVCFSGSLYARALAGWQAPFAPFGGTLLMLGWLGLLPLAAKPSP